MKIGIDARIFKYKEFSGIPNSVYEIIKRWMVTEKDNEYYLISNSEIVMPCELPSNWKKVIVPAVTGNGTLWQLFRVRGIIKKLDLDYYWGTNYVLPRRIKGCKYLLTVYDLSFEIMPKVTSGKTLRVLKTLCQLSCKRADVIHAISESTKRDIVDLYGIKPEKVSVVYLAPSEEKKAKEVEPPEYNFILVLGTIEPRKNIDTIVRAFDKFKEKDEKDIHIIFAGRYGWKYESFKRLVEESPYKQFIHIMEYVDNDTKVMLLNNAQMLMYPSLYEGFGMPILEAFQHDLFVVTARNSSIPEVAGEAAFYVDDCYDFEGLAERVREVLLLDETEKLNLQKKMQQQLSVFSWDKCSREMMEILKR